MTSPAWRAPKSNVGRTCFDGYRRVQILMSYGRQHCYLTLFASEVSQATAIKRADRMFGLSQQLFFTLETQRCLVSSTSFIDCTGSRYSRSFLLHCNSRTSTSRTPACSFVPRLDGIFTSVHTNEVILEGSRNLIKMELIVFRDDFSFGSLEWVKTAFHS